MTPRVPLLLLVIAYAGWVVAFATGIFWEGTAAAKLVGVILVIVAPIVFAYQGWYFFKRRNASAIHLGVAIFSWLYLPALGGVLLWVLTRRATP